MHHATPHPPIVNPDRIDSLEDARHELRAAHRTIFEQLQMIVLKDDALNQLAGRCPIRS
ncbi:MAG: hypothetical protein VB131_06035 [Burkholderia gladioli]